MIKFKKNLTVFSDNGASAKAFGQFKSKLKREGKIIEDFDILIASVAFVNKSILVTNNTNHFERLDEIELKTG